MHVCVVYGFDQHWTDSFLFLVPLNNIYRVIYYEGNGITLQSQVSGRGGGSGVLSVFEYKLFFYKFLFCFNKWLNNGLKQLNHVLKWASLTSVFSNGNLYFWKYHLKEHIFLRAAQLSIVMLHNRIQRKFIL